MYMSALVCLSVCAGQACGWSKRVNLDLTFQAVRLVELLDEAKARCETSIKERQEATIERGGEELSAEELDNISSVMGYGAVKYADLKNNRSTNYK